MKLETNAYFSPFSFQLHPLLPGGLNLSLGMYVLDDHHFSSLFQVSIISLNYSLTKVMLPH